MHELLAQQYDSLYASAHGRYGDAPLPIVKELCDHVTSGRVLDVGGGDGRNALFLARQGFSVVATDISQVGLDRIAEAAKAEQLSIETKCSDVVKDGIDGMYDVIVNTFVLHHLQSDDALRVIEEMQEHTAARGYNIIAMFTNLGGLYERNQKAASGRYYPAADAVRALYADWKIHSLIVRETTTYAKDKHGNRLKNEMIVLLAQK